MTLEKKTSSKKQAAETTPAEVIPPRDSTAGTCPVSVVDSPLAGRPLQGAKAIAEYCDISLPTLMRRIFSEGLPATQIGGVWVSDTGLLDRWRIGRIEQDTKNRVQEMVHPGIRTIARW
jgi:hypothetical protein